MYTKATSALIYLFIVSLCQISAVATENPGAQDALPLAPRQTTTPTISCLEYATVANLSTINTNSTFRAAFLQSAPFGTDKSQGILNGATKTLKTAINDKALNDQCGNLTAVAIREAPLNFTQGIVGPFQIKQASAAAYNGRSLAMCLLTVMGTMGAALLL